MNKRKKQDKYGNLLEKEGEKTDNIHRNNIGEETAQLLRDGKIQEYLARIHDIDLEKQETDGDEEQGYEPETEEQ